MEKEVVDVDREKVKQVLAELKRKYGEYWKENYEKVLQIYREFVDRIINGEDPRVLELELLYKYRETLNEYRDINKLFWFRFGVRGAKVLDDEGVEKFREFLKKLKETRSSDEAWNILYQYKEAIRGMKIVALSTWASIIRPEWFVPLWWDYHNGALLINHCG